MQDLIKDPSLCQIEKISNTLPGHILQWKQDHIWVVSTPRSILLTATCYHKTIKPLSVSDTFAVAGTASREMPQFMYEAMAVRLRLTTVSNTVPDSLNLWPANTTILKSQIGFFLDNIWLSVSWPPFFWLKWGTTVLQAAYIFYLS